MFADEIRIAKIKAPSNIYHLFIHSSIHSRSTEYLFYIRPWTICWCQKPRRVKPGFQWQTAWYEQSTGRISRRNKWLEDSSNVSGLSCKKSMGFITEATGMILKGFKQKSNQICLWKTDWWQHGKVNGRRSRLKVTIIMKITNKNIY